MPSSRSRTLATSLLLIVMGCSGGSAAGGPSNAPRVGPRAPSSRTPPSPAAGAADADPWPELGGWVELETSPGGPELAEGARAVREKDWRGARTAFEAALTSLDGEARLDLYLAGQALLGRACAAQGDAPAASAAFGRVLRRWNGAATARAVIAGAGDDGAPGERLQRVLLAVGEAMFFEGEQKRATLERARMPTFAGPADDAAIDRFVVDRVSPWIDAKQPLLLDAEAAYARVVALEPAPPPRWAVRAAARVGQIRGRFAAELRAAPIPAAWRGKGAVAGDPRRSRADVRATYYRAIDRRAAPLVDRARVAFEACEKLARDLGYHDELTRTCTAWLDTRR